MSTKKELLAAAKKLGISVTAQNSVDEIRKAINDMLGEPTIAGHNEEQNAEITDSIAMAVIESGEGAIATKTGPVIADARDIPNLAPNGQWEGKRARIIRIKTGQNDMGGALFRWNGWPCLIPLDQPVDIAWPIYEILKTTKGLRISIEQVEDAKNKGRVQNITKESRFDKYPFQFLGVTPGTEHLPESAWEYVLDQYVAGFPGYDVRKWRQLCALFELSDVDCKLIAGATADEESKSRSYAIHYTLNLPQGADEKLRLRVRDEKRADIRMPPKAA